MKFPLGQDTHDPQDILCMVKSLLGGDFTMGSTVSRFESEFADSVGSRHAVMVNSGSSANLLALAALTNHKCGKLKAGDEILVPAVCWSTSVWPIIQCGMKPVFVDVCPNTLNMDLDDPKAKISPRTRGVMAVHVLGNTTDMAKLVSICRRDNLVLIEDSCEALGSKFAGKHLGTFGSIGTYSFYYSHHITTMEGGMLVTDDDDLYELLKCLRAHGWTRQLRDLDREKIEAEHPDLDPRFTFVNLGYNVRPLEVQAAMGLNQLAKLENKNANRKANYARIKAKLSDERNDFLAFPTEMQEADVAWFGVALFIKDKNIGLSDYLGRLTACGVENRPIVTGNMVRQPVIQDLYPDLDPRGFPGAEYVHEKGFFIGLSCTPMTDERVEDLVEILLRCRP